jgi:homoserine acetyltransferase
MQSLASAALFPNRVNRIISISAAARSHPLSVALRYLQRTVLTSDPNWNSGNYYDSAFPFLGMKLAREIATVSYRSGPEWETRFGRARVEEDSSPKIATPDFLIEQYLSYQVL